ncbi:MAG: N-carbamoylsarcosine amidase [Hyphomicrobiales bacterium]|nr:N-carbamoylsarcosine amidase [Hyphomicrobiales bacterium]
MSDAAIYSKQGFGARSGFGQRAALLVVDFVNGFNDPDMFGGGNIPQAIANAQGLLAAAREAGAPVCFTRVVYADDGSDAGVFRLKAPTLGALTESSHASQVVPELAPLAGEYVLRKTQPSAFFGTDLAGWLAFRRVDTVLVVGATTSGCVRASVVDSMSYNFRTVVVADCVGDRALGPHEANLFDMGQKYADLHESADVIAWLRTHEA